MTRRQEQKAKPKTKAFTGRHAAEGLVPVNSERARRLPPGLRDAPIYNYLLSDGRLTEFALKVKALDISTVGDFVKYGEDQIYTRAPTTPKNRERVRGLLATFGL